MKRLATRISCDEPGCRNVTLDPRGWREIAGEDICPFHLGQRQRAAERAWLALSAPLPPARTHVQARGAQRRLQALMVHGWSADRLADALGLNAREFGALQRVDRVTVQTHRRIGVLFDRLWDVAPPAATTADVEASCRARRDAARHGWLPALAWDDIDTDDAPPGAVESGEPDEGAIELALQGAKPRLRRAERLEAVRALHERRWSDKKIADHLGTSDKQVLRDRQGMGLAAFPYEQLEFAA